MTRMTSRRIAVYALLLVALVLIVLFVIAPLPAHAQSFRAADQVYLQTAGHAVGATTFATELRIMNLSNDAITVSITFAPANTADDDQRYAFEQYLPARIVLAPHECREVSDERLASMVPTGIGMFIFEACKLGADCSTQYDRVGCCRVEKVPNVLARRPISVTARVYSYVGGATNGTRGETWPGVAWYDVWTVDGAAVGMDRPFITGVRSDGHYRTNVMMANASSYSSIALRATLYDGTSGLSRATFDTTILPLHNYLIGAEVMFPMLAESRLKRDTPVRNPWIGFEQIAVMPNALAAEQRDVWHGCADGCPGFLVQASLIDTVTSDAMRLVAQNELSGEAETVAGVSAFKTAALATPRTERLNDVLHLAFKGARCSIEPGDTPGDYRVRRLDGAEWLHVNVAEWNKARELCEMGQSTEAR